MAEVQVGIDFDTEEMGRLGFTRGFNVLDERTVSEGPKTWEQAHEAARVLERLAEQLRLMYPLPTTTGR